MVRTVAGRFLVVLVTFAVFALGMGMGQVLFGRPVAEAAAVAQSE